MVQDMSRKVFAAALLTFALASVAIGQPHRGVMTGPMPVPPMQGATPIDPSVLTISTSNISGTVQSVSSSTILIADGFFAIDASQARIVGYGPPMTIASIHAGDHIVAMLTKSDVVSNAPLPASIVVVMRADDVQLTGTVQSIDAAHAAFTVLGRTIHVTSSTFFAAMPPTAVKSVADLAAGTIVSIDATIANGEVEARTVMVMPASGRLMP